MAPVKSQFSEIMKQATNHLMNNKWLATMLVFLSVFIPYAGSLGLLIIAFITLRKSPREGAYLSGAIIIPTLFLMRNADASMLLPLINLIITTLLLWCLAFTLRTTASWSRTLETGAFFVSFLIIIVHFFAQEIVNEWSVNLIKEIDATITSVNTDITQHRLAIFTKLSTSLLTASMFLSTLFFLLLARGVQAVAFNPGGLSQELREIRLSWFTLLFLAIILLGIKLGSTLAFQFLPVVLFLFCIAGVSLIHRLLSQLQLSRFYLAGFYLLMVFIFPYMLLVLLLLAIADIYFNFRKLGSVLNPLS